MLGDSQIGKTSLMVKYVEGHFDEDYIQTLGAYPTLYTRVVCSFVASFRHLHRCFLILYTILTGTPYLRHPLHTHQPGSRANVAADPLTHCPRTANSYRRQLHGEDHHCAPNVHHVLAMGFGRAARVREHVAAGVQRCGGDPLHVRSLAEVDVEFGEGVVSTSKGIQQGSSSPSIFPYATKSRQTISLLFVDSWSVLRANCPSCCISRGVDVT